MQLKKLQLNGPRFNVYMLFNKRTGVFYRVLNHEVEPSGFRPDATRAASLLNGFKKRVPLGVPTKVQIVSGEHTRKTRYALLVCFI